MPNQRPMPDLAKTYANQIRVGRPELFFTAPPDPARIRTEWSIGHSRQPHVHYRRFLWLHRHRRWRWSLTRFYQVETHLPGVDGRVRMTHVGGFTFTRVGAFHAAGMALVRRG